METFYINPSWLHDENAKIYQEMFVYKSAIRNYVDLILLKNKENTFPSLIIIKPKGNLKDHSMVKVLLEERCEINGVEFNRHIVFQDLWHWHDGPGHQLRLMTRMYFSMKGLGFIFGNSASLADLDGFDSGSKFYSELKLSQQDWHPDEFAVCSHEGSGVAKDSDRMSNIIKWSRQKCLVQYFEEKSGIKIDSNPLRLRLPESPIDNGDK